MNRCAVCFVMLYSLVLSISAASEMHLSTKAPKVWSLKIKHDFWMDCACYKHPQQQQSTAASWRWVLHWQTSLVYNIVTSSSSWKCRDVVGIKEALWKLTDGADDTGAVSVSFSCDLPRLMWLCVWVSRWAGGPAEYRMADWLQSTGSNRRLLVFMNWRERLRIDEILSESLMKYSTGLIILSKRLRMSQQCLCRALLPFCIVLFFHFIFSSAVKSINRD